MFSPSSFVAAGDLEQEFASPPASARPHVYWYWMNGYITQEGIDADLEAMKRAGIGGAVIFNIGGHGLEPGPVKVLSTEWRGLMKHAIVKAGELGIEVNLNNSAAGWSHSGGPWITPELAMQRITFSEVTVKGGSGFDEILAQPPTRLQWYRDVAVVAFPTPEAERNPAPVATITSSDPKFDASNLVPETPGVPGGANWDDSGAKPASVAILGKTTQARFVRMEYSQPFAARSLHLAFAGAGSKGTLETSENGREWRQVREFTPRNRAPVDLAFAGAPARYWRLIFPAGEQLRLTELNLSARLRLAEWTGKAMFDSCGLDRPSFTASSVATTGDGAIHREEIVDLTGKLDPSGRLVWSVPPGDWTIMRFGYTPTGSMTGPANAEGGGLDCDKFNPKAVEVHWANALAPRFRDPELNKIVRYVHADSYERGAQNWTTRFASEFQQRRGYNLTRYLPVLAGRVVGGVGESERFLWDFRNVACSLMTDNYFRRLQELCHRDGKLFTLEPYHQTQFNDVTAGGCADVPMCESWTGPAPAGPYWHKLGASPAHIYGKPIVGCEAFTAPGQYGGNWSTDFWALKPFGDAMFCGGVNRFVLHVYAHQPWPDRVPGMSLAIYGTHFERTNTWWEQMPAFTGYIARCSHLLRQGRFVADALYFVGENSPNEGLQPSGKMTLPHGYDYDVCDLDVILKRLSVKDGRLVLPDGMSYRLLVLPEDTTMTPVLLRKLRELVRAGATVIGPKPDRSPSLTDQPAADEEVRRLADELWSSGSIAADKTVAQVLAEKAILPDFDAGSSEIHYIHRQLPDGELYFVANTKDQVQRVTASFRSGAGLPQVWDPVSGQRCALPDAREQSARIQTPLEFAPRQSLFVVFGRAPAALPAPVSPFIFPGLELNTPWEVRFDPKRGGPKQPVVFAKLDDWSQRSEPDIRYYSGKATYRTTFKLPAAVLDKRSYLDLGTVKNVAVVRLNGHNLGIVWCAPWRVEITGIARALANELEIDIVNLWPNRMIGDEQLPDDCEWNTGDWITLKRLPEWFVQNAPRPSGRLTFATFKHFTKASPLLPSGLLGPVTVRLAIGSKSP